MSTATLQEPISDVGDDELYEIIDGQRVRIPPMGVFAVWTASRLVRFLGNFTEEYRKSFGMPAMKLKDLRPMCQSAVAGFGKPIEDVAATTIKWINAERTRCAKKGGI